MSLKEDTRDLSKLCEQIKLKKNPNKHKASPVIPRFQKNQNIYNKPKAKLKEMNLDIYESDFIDDGDMDNNSSHNQWNDKLVSGVIKQLYGRNKYD